MRPSCTTDDGPALVASLGHMSAQTSQSQRRRLGILLALNAAMIAGLIIVGVLSHSLGVLAAGGDYIADSAAIALGIGAVAMRERGGERSKAPTIVALINALALLTVTAFVVGEAIRRLVQGSPDVQGLPVLIVSALATAVMVLGVFVLGTDAGQEDLHMRSVLLDTVADAVASAAVAVSGAVIYVTGSFFWLDSALAAAIGVLIAVGAVRLLREAAHALRTGSALDLDD
jgi:cobalt-zinc-cadmium efflux system protein